MTVFGPGFESGKHEWLYSARHTQSVAMIIALFVALLLINVVGQNVASVVGYNLLGGKLGAGAGVGAEAQSLMFKGMVIGLVPASLVAIGAAWWFAGWQRQDRVEVLALRRPQLGWGGWIAVLIGFLVAVYLLNAGVFAVTGLNPQDYAPSSDGVLDKSNSSGLVEKAMADLANEPLLFALALPGVTIIVPMMEELLFRGALFTAIAQSKIGRAGAVVITSGLWAVMHAMSAPWLFVSLIFLMGLVLGIILLRWGSLWVTIACHCLWNSLSSATIFSLVMSN